MDGLSYPSDWGMVLVMRPDAWVCRLDGQGLPRARQTGRTTDEPHLHGSHGILPDGKLRPRLPERASNSGCKTLLQRVLEGLDCTC